MNNNDYSQEEIYNIVNDLYSCHFDKLKGLEKSFLANILNKNTILDQPDRDRLIKLYDGVRDIPGE